MTALLAIGGLSRHFGSIKAVSGVTLAIAADEIRGIVGPNGAGKTTLFNLITGFIKPSSGRVVFDGQDVTNRSIPDRVARGMARTFQTPQLFAELSVLENVMVGAYARILRGKFGGGRPAAEEKARDILQFVGLSESLSRVAGELAYPAQRRLEIARALMTEPRLVLLDEPAAGMNPAEAAQLTELIRSIHARKCGVVVVEHNMKLIMDVSQRVSVMNFGAVIAEGTPMEIRRDPAVISAYLGSQV